MHSLRALVESACTGLDAAVQARPIVQETLRNLYDGIAVQDVVTRPPSWPHAPDREGARLHLMPQHACCCTHRPEVLGHEQHRRARPHLAQFVEGLRKGCRAPPAGRTTAAVRSAASGAALVPSRDLQFDYLGLQTLYDRYFLHVQQRREMNCPRPSSCAWPWAWR